MTQAGQEQNLRRIATVVWTADGSGEFIRNADGSTLYLQRFPVAMESWHLRALADELDRRNTAWLDRFTA